MLVTVFSVKSTSRLPSSIIVVLIMLVVTGVIYLYSLRDTYRGIEKLEGPSERSIIQKEQKSDWETLNQGKTSRLAILLTDTDSSWLGIRHALDTIGVPYLITTDVSQAVKHQVVLAYPMISGALLKSEELDLLRSHVTGGGCLIATQVVGGGMQDLFGFKKVTEQREHFEVKFNSNHPLTQWLEHPMEQTVRIGNPKRPETWIGTQVYHEAEEVIATFQDGRAAWVCKAQEGGGIAHAIGFDLGFWILKCQNDRDEEASRSYVNDYTPSMDVWLRMLRHIYLEREPLAVTMDTVPDGKDLAVVVSHDVDFARSMDNLSAYRDLAIKQGVPATYFIQAKYYRDYYDSGFINDGTFQMLKDLDAAGMEIGSHSVSHTSLFASLKMGDGKERFPDYQPRVIAADDTRGATILGELRVSRFLLEEIVDTKVRSFRPGFLAFPQQLPQALAATGYCYSSSVTAGNVMTHLPYRMNYNREYEASVDVFEFPVSIEDEKLPKMDERVEEAMQLAEQLAKYGGSYVILSHPDVQDHKLGFLELIIPRLKPFSWFGTIGSYGDWWVARDRLEVDVEEKSGEVILDIKAPIALNGMSFRIPCSWRTVEQLPETITLEDGSLFFSHIEGNVKLRFKK